MNREEFEKILNSSGADLHVHSRFSPDSFLRPKRIAEFGAYRKRYVAITDHNEIAGAHEAKNFDPENWIIIGEEIATTDWDGEILAYGIREKIDPGPVLTVIDEIHRQGGFAVLSHPFRTGYVFKKKLKIIAPEIIEKIDGVEVFNARNSNGENKKASEFAEKYGKLKTRGSDAHMLWELHCAGNSSSAINLFKNLLTVIIKCLKKIF